MTFWPFIEKAREILRYHLHLLIRSIQERGMNYGPYKLITAVWQVVPVRHMFGMVFSACTTCFAFHKALSTSFNSLVHAKKSPTGCQDSQ